MITQEVFARIAMAALYQQIPILTEIHCDYSDSPVAVGDVVGIDGTDATATLTAHRVAERLIAPQDSILAMIESAQRVIEPMVAAIAEKVRADIERAVAEAILDEGAPLRSSIAFVTRPIGGRSGARVDYRNVGITASLSPSVPSGAAATVDILYAVRNMTADAGNQIPALT